jgi:hypothetical protein
LCASAHAGALCVSALRMIGVLHVCACLCVLRLRLASLYVAGGGKRDKRSPRRGRNASAKLAPPPSSCAPRPQPITNLGDGTPPPPIPLPPQVTRTLKLLPPGSVQSFAVGNEPDMYTLSARDGLPAVDQPKTGNWLG